MNISLSHHEALLQVPNQEAQRTAQRAKCSRHSLADQVVVRVNLDMRGRVLPARILKFKKGLTQRVQPFLGGAADLSEQHHRHQKVLAVFD